MSAADFVLKNLIFIDEKRGSYDFANETARTQLKHV